MAEIVEVNDRGCLEIPSTLIGNAVPHTRFLAERDGTAVVVRPVASSPALTWDQRTPEQRAAAFLDWVKTFNTGHPALPESALSRESMYA